MCFKPNWWLIKLLFIIIMDLILSNSLDVFLYLVLEGYFIYKEIDKLKLYFQLNKVCKGNI